MHDVTIVGGGPAGISGALLLARARRDVLLIDSGEGRNAGSDAVHLLLSREGVPPDQLRAASWEQAVAYPNVGYRRAEAVSAARADGTFEVTLADGSVERSRRLLLATGVRDVLPDIEGLPGIWGRSAFLCPYCDGWEVRDRTVGMVFTGSEDIQFAMMLTKWSQDLAVFPDGEAAMSDDDRAALRAAGVTVHDRPMVRVVARDGRLEEVVLDDGSQLARSVLYIHTRTEQRSDLALQLGCRLLEDDSVEVDFRNCTTVPGVYAVGDMARPPYQPTPIAYVAAAATTGLMAGTFLDTELFQPG